MREELPGQMQRHLNGFTTTGENWRTSSKAEVYQYRRADGAAVFLKVEADERAAGLAAECRHLEWLQGKLPVPKVLGYCCEGGREYLLTEALPGVAAHKGENRRQPGRTAQAVAEALKRIHAVPIADCPFDRRYPQLLDRARRFVERGWADGEEGNPETRLAAAAERAPAAEDLVFTHGDYCLPNVLLQEGGCSGLVDWGYAGVGDRYIDLAACASSVRRNLGEAWVPVFCAHYGLREPDQRKIDLYLGVRLSD